MVILFMSRSGHFGTVLSQLLLTIGSLQLASVGELLPKIT